MPSTLLLNPQAWDLLVDAAQNIAVAKEPYALAQDAASAIKLFEGEDYYDTTRGVPYWDQILGHWPSVSLMKSYFITAAESVPNVVSAQCFISAIIDRRPIGQVLVKGASGQTAVVALANTIPKSQIVPPHSTLLIDANTPMLIEPGKELRIQ